MTSIKLQEFTQQYIVEEKIGTGSYGRVYRVRNKKDGTLFAFKKMIIHRNSNLLGDVVHEIVSLCNMEHELVVKLFKFYIHEYPFGVLMPGIEVGLIMELGKMSVWDFIEQRKRKKDYWLPLPLLEHFAYSFIELFASMQEKNKSHRDIKPENFLVFDEKEFKCKLADFGQCKQVEQQGIQFSNELAGTPHYMSPKLKAKCDAPHAKISTDLVKDDVYSFGVTLYQLALLDRTDFCRPFKFEFLASRYECTWLINLIEIMMEKEEEKRPTFRHLRDIIKKEMQRPQPVIKPVEIIQVAEPNLTSISQPAEERPIPALRIEPADTQIGIHSACLYKDLVFVGSESGEVKVLFDKRTFHLPKSHYSQNEGVCSVEVLETVGDEVWSAGCDSRVFVWDCKLILKEIQDCKPSSQLSQCSLFPGERSTERNLIENEKVRNQKDEVPAHDYGISCLLSAGPLMAVGYFGGRLFVQNGDKKVDIKIHYEKISCIKQREHRLYTAGIDGMLKVFDLQAMQLLQTFISIPGPIIGIKHLPKQIEIITMNGMAEIVDYDLKKICPAKPISNSPIFSCCFTEKHNIILNADGELYDQQRRIARVECEGPNNVCVQDELIFVTSFKGRIFHIRP